MADAGVDNIIVHYGNSSGGTIGSSTTMSTEESIDRTGAVIDALQPNHRDLIVTCHGGGIECPGIGIDHDDIGVQPLPHRLPGRLRRPLPGRLRRHRGRMKRPEVGKRQCEF